MNDVDKERSLLLGMLEQHFRESIDLVNTPVTVEQLPDSLWERALLDPVREFLNRPGKGFRARLLATSWALACDDDRQMPASLPFVVELLHAGSLIVDDIQDGSQVRRGAPTLHRLYGIPLAINVGSWLYFWSLSLLGQLIIELVPAPVQAEILQRANRTMLYCHQGQALDLATPVHALPPADVPAAVSLSTSLKTGVLMEFAAFLGARAAGANSERSALIGRFGHQVGVGLQMLDDLGGVLSESRRHKAIEDMLLARLTWPWAWLARIENGRSNQRAGAAATGRLDGWQERARTIAESGDRVAAASLLVDMAGVVGDHGRAQIAKHLASTLAELRTRCGPSAHLFAMEAELERLEKSYG